MALFYMLCAMAAVFVGVVVLQIAYFPIYKLLGGGDNFLMYLQYLFAGVRTW